VSWAVADPPYAVAHEDQLLAAGRLIHDVAGDELGRQPLPFETSRPGLFAAGDVRAGSTKRVAAAVGEGPRRSAPSTSTWPSLH
jgi:thioredoxin reductase (NADPH)